VSTVKTNVIANYVGKIWTGGLNILLIPVYIKFLGIEAYGLVGFFASLSSVLGILDLGIGATLNREIAKFSIFEESVKNQRNLVKTLGVVYWAIALGSFFIVFFSASYISESWLNNEVLQPASARFSIQMMAVSIALNFPVSLYQGGLMGMQKQVLVNKIQMFVSTFRNVGVILVFLVVKPSIEIFFVWQAIASLLSVTIFYFSIWKLLPKEYGGGFFSISLIRNIWRYAAAVSASAIIGVILSQLDKVILSKTLSLESFGYYNIASNLASSIWMIIVPYNSALFPKLVQLSEGSAFGELKSIFHRSSQLLSLILFPFCSVLIFFSYEVLIIWTNDINIANNVYQIVSLLAFGIMLNGMASLPSNLASASGWPMLITYTNLIQSVFIIPLILILVNLYGALGAAISWVIMNSTYILFMVPYFFTKILINEKKGWYFRDTLIPLFFSFCVSFFFKIFIPHDCSSFVLLLWISVAFFFSLVSIIVYFYMSKSDIYLDIINIVCKIIKTAK
jgi:O-antigen/teichoic acid export membrane protein